MSEMEENLEKMKEFRFTQRPNFIISPCGMCHLPIAVGEEGCFVGVGSNPASVLATHMKCAEEAMRAGKCDYMMSGDGCFCDHGLGDDGEPCRQCDGMGSIDNHPGAEYIWKKDYQVGAVKPPPIYMIVNTEGKVEEWIDGDSWTHLGVHLSRKEAEEIERSMKAADPDDKDDPTKYRMVKYVPEEKP